MSASTPKKQSRIFAEIRAELARELSRGARNLLPVLASELEAAGERSASDRDRQSLFEACASLRLEPGQRATRIAAAFETCVARIVKANRISDPEARSLALIDDEAFGLSLLAQPLARAARDLDPERYRRFAARARAISPADWQDDEFNPLGAKSLATALVSALNDLADSPAVQANLRAVLPGRAGPLLGSLISQAEHSMSRRGVRPGESPSMPDDELAASRASPARAADEPPAVGAAPIDADQPGESPDQVGPADRRSGSGPVERVARLDADARMLGTSPLAALTGEQKLRVLPTLQPVLEIERDAVAFAHSIGEIPYSRSARSHYFQNVRRRLEKASATTAQLAVVDVVAAMFDYVVDDRRLPQAAHPLVWRLQHPALALALLDPGYLGDEPRSLRRLIENFGAIANAFADDLTRGSELYRRMETVVRAVEIVTSALQTRSAVMSRQVEREYSRAAGHVAQLIDRIVRERVALESTPERRNRRDYTRRPDRDQEREVTARLEQMLEERLARHSVPESVREFLRGVWLRHLRTAVFRDGEESGEFRVALQVVDDLLWTLDGSAEKRVSRSELVQRIPPLIQVLTQGLREIGAKEDEHRGFFDELFLIHLRKLQRRNRSSTVVFPPELSDQAIDASASANAVNAATGSEAATGERGPARVSRATMYDVQGSVPTLNDAISGSELDESKSPVEPAASTNRAQADDAESVDADAQAAQASQGHQLLEVLNAVDLADLPEHPKRRLMDPAQAFASLKRGDWLEMEGRDGSQRYMKIAWINRRRTVALMVRTPDRRALSLQMVELARRFIGGRVFLIES